MPAPGKRRLGADAGQPPICPLPYRLGLPAWAFPGWQGRYLRRSPHTLADYARVFNTVEGNTSFYRIPDQTSVTRWAKAVAGRDFRFCWKLPREVTHDRRPDLALLDRFLARIEPLGAHNGPLLLQFPASIGPGQLDRVRRVAERLPTDRRHVLEVRHPAFFSVPEAIARLDALLDEFQLGRVCLDSRALYAGDPEHPAFRDARHEKPELPVLPERDDGISFLRLVLHPDPVGNGPWIEQAARRAAAALASGADLTVTIHCPDNGHCPQFAETFHHALGQACERPDWPSFPDWPTGQGRLF